MAFARTWFGLCACIGFSASAFAESVVVAPGASALERFAAREVVRYAFLRTGKLLPIMSSPRGDSIVVTLDKSLAPQAYRLTTKGSRLTVAGGDPIGTLYGAYRLAEHLGVRFYLHGDTIPDVRVPFRLPRLNEVGRPLFSLRGIQPFHDFPEGPDWWSRDDYLAVVGQLPKMRMNWIGFHAYPPGGAGPEPLVWIGRREDLTPDGKVKAAYPAWWANTQRDGAWGYRAARTGEFSGGGSQLFAQDVFAPEVMEGLTPRSGKGQPSILLFNRVGELLRQTFDHARALGVKTCLGTEAPLSVPNEVATKDARSLYEGMLERIRRSHPADYFWLWTPEDWTWGGNSPEQYRRTVDDVKTAFSVLPSGMRMATSGWVLGPQHDRAALHKDLPKDVAMSAISRQVGHAPLDRAFGDLGNRQKWAIPWLENDPALTAPQLWVGRMRYDAADARRLGCDGLMGIHWRTRVVAPTVATLAAAAWQQPWSKQIRWLPEPKDAVGGSTASFGEPVGGTEEDPVYQSVRYGMSGYALELPNGRYRVTLKFNEPHYSEPGRRVFGVSIQGKTVIHGLDLVRDYGKNQAKDFVFDAEVTDAKLRVRFLPQTEYPCIAGIVVEGEQTSRRINCGGPAILGYEADLEGSSEADARRTAPVLDFYRDFALAEFGLPEVGDLFASIDGTRLPEPATWIEGPGGIKVEKPDLSRYRFVDRMAALRGKVKGAGNRSRYDYWLDTFNAMREMARLGGQREELDEMVGRGRFEEARQQRRAMARTWDRLIGYTLRTVSSPGELGTIANLEQHVLRTQRILHARDEEIEKGSGMRLPEDASPSATHRGPSRLIVPTVRSQARPGETIRIRAIVLSLEKPVLRWRHLGKGPFRSVPFRHRGRGVYDAPLPMPSSGLGLEYYVVAGNGGKKRVFPPTAPRLNQTVVLGP